MSESNQHIRLMPDEIEALESFAQAHGIPATLDHLGLDGLGNQVNGLIEQLETLRNCVEEYADLDNWEAVRSPETTSAWQKRWGHPTPWVDAQHALDDVSNPASRSTDA